ncbi:MAG: helix-turn-helix domain-containing protein [Kineosporiaceae bacterium]
MGSSTELGDRIREARTAMGRTQDEIAAALGVDRSAVARIEVGERKVSALELDALGRALGLPLVHFLSRPPAAITSRRRQLAEDTTSTSATAYRADALLQAHLRDAEQLRGTGYLRPTGDLPSGTVDSPDAARALAAAVREFADLAGPLNGMCEVAERVGLYILVVDEQIEGSSLTPDHGYGVAVVGGREQPGRRRFTAAHEIGHHVLGDEYQADSGVAASRDERERLIDAFASELLLPRHELSREWSRSPGSAFDRLVVISARYRASWRVAVISAAAEGLVSADEGQALQRRSPHRGDFVRLLGISPEPDLVIGETGPRWRQAAVAAYVDGLVSAERAVELVHGALGIDDLPEIDEVPV